VIIKVSVTGAEKAAAVHAGIAARMRNLQPAMVQIGEGFREGVEAQFQSGGWAPLKPYTIAWKGHATKLVHTGGMAASWTIRGAPSNISVEGAMRGKWGTSHELVGWHQFGTSRMVARPVTVPPLKFDSVIVNEISDYIMNGG
jgi:hypothetical protein